MYNIWQDAGIRTRVAATATHIPKELMSKYLSSEVAKVPPRCQFSHKRFNDTAHRVPTNIMVYRTGEDQGYHRVKGMHFRGVNTWYHQRVKGMNFTGVNA